MSLLSPPYSRAWIAVPLLALGFMFWNQLLRVQRVQHVTGIVPGEAVASSTSPTGYSGGIRNQVVPGQNQDSFHWIAQTQQMLARKEWRVRQIDYENAPLGRSVLAPSPYRWWLGLVAWIDHAVSGRPLSLGVERAALFSDPLLHLLLFGSTVILTFRRFGASPAVLLALGLVALFPFAADFLPGIPDEKSLSHACVFASILFLLAGVRPAHRAMAPAGGAIRAMPQTGLWFFWSGVANGIGLWVSAAGQVPVILGIAAGALIAAWAVRREEASGAIQLPAPANWSLWALGGSASSLGFYLIEYFPSHLGSWRLQAIHPLYSLAWLGLGGALNLVTARIRGQWPGWTFRLWILAGFAVVSLTAIPVAMWQTKNLGFLVTDLSSFRLTRLPGSTEATTVWAWLKLDGFSPTVWAALLPVVLGLGAAGFLLRKSTSAVSRVSLAVVLGPALVMLGFASWRLGHWGGLDSVLLVLLIAITVALRENSPRRLSTAGWIGLCVLVLAPGWFQLRPSSESRGNAPLIQHELAGLIARDLAHWVANHAGGETPVVLAPPDETAALAYYGGLRGIGTLSWENQAGINAVVRIFRASSLLEVRTLCEGRAVTHLIIPSWDLSLAELARQGTGQEDGGFLASLRTWALPNWLRPVPYHLPEVPGYEGQSVSVFEVVDEQDDATGLSWLAEYFVEMGRLDYAAAVGKSLQRFPADLGAWTARAQVAFARRDGVGLADTIKVLSARLEGSADHALLWDRRVSLALVLARGKRLDLARGQAQRCLAEITEPRLRSLTTYSLYDLLMLNKALGLEIADPGLRRLALDLLSPELRARL